MEPNELNEQSPPRRDRKKIKILRLDDLIAEIDDQCTKLDGHSDPEVLKLINLIDLQSSILSTMVDSVTENEIEKTAMALEISL